MSLQNQNQQPPRPDRAHPFLFGIRFAYLFIPLIVLYLASIAPEFGWDHQDTVYYLTLARSISEGDGYAINGLPHVKYPPGWPLLMAPFVAAVGIHFVSLHVLVVLLSFGALGCSYYVMRGRSPSKLVALAVFITPLSYFFWSFSTIFLTSEMFYTATSFLGLGIAYQLTQRPLSGSRKRVLLHLVLVLAYATRTIGLSLFMAVSAADLLAAIKQGRSEFYRGIAKSALTLLVLALVSFAWIDRSNRLEVTQGEPYLQEFSKNVSNQTTQRSPIVNLASIVFRNIPLHLSNVGATVVPFVRRTAELNWLAMAVGGVVLLGFLRRISEKVTVLELYAVFYAGIVMLWPYWEESSRFWLPLLPLLFWDFFSGLQTIALQVQLWLDPTISYVRQGLVPVLLVGLVMLLAWHAQASDQAALVLAEGCYLGMLLFFVIRWMQKDSPRMLVCLLALYAFHSGAFAAYRTTLKYRNHSFREAGLYGNFEAAVWLKEWGKKQNPATPGTVYSDEPLFVSLWTGQPVWNLPPATEDAPVHWPERNQFFVLSEPYSEREVNLELQLKLAGQLRFTGEKARIYSLDAGEESGQDPEQRIQP